jgi:prevent-host-death family protein
VTPVQNPVALPALHEALDAAARAALLAESGDVHTALLALRDAGCAAGKAFPPRSPEAAALATVLRSIAGSEETAVAEMSVRELRADLAEVINAAGTRGQVTFVTSRGRRVAAVVSVTAGERAQ